MNAIPKTTTQKVELLGTECSLRSSVTTILVWLQNLSQDQIGGDGG